MPRRTRRSDELSAAAQSEDESTDAVANESISAVDGAEATSLVPRVRTPRQRKTPVASTETPSEVSEPEAKPVEPRTIAKPPAVRRRPAKRPEALTTPAVESVTGADTTQNSPAEPALVDAVDAEFVQRKTPLRRRVGGRRSPEEAASAVSDETLAPQTGSLAQDAPTAPSSRNRRRRGNKRPVPVAEPIEAIVESPTDIVDEILDISADGVVTIEPTSVSDEDRKRSRRSRRGGRRRSGRAGDVEGSTDAENEDADNESESVELDLPVLSAPPPPFKAPALVPTAESLGLTPITLRSSAKLTSDASGFDINGDYYGPELFFVNAETAEDPTVVGEQIKLAANIGIHLHSGVAYLPFKNAYGVRSFASIQSLITQVLDADPEAYIIVRLQCVPTNFWARMHPDEMSVYSDGSNGDVSFASQEFWQDTVDAVAALLQFIGEPETFGGDRVIGLHLDKGEWFNDANSGYDYSAPNKRAFRDWLHERYQTPYSLRASWFSGTATFETSEIPKWLGSPTSRKKEEVVLLNRQNERTYVDYNAFTSDIMAQAITGVAASIKWLSNGQLLVGTSYGYTLEFATRNDSGHQALGKVLESPAIDIVAGPNSYSTRQAGGAGSFSSPVDSAKLHGKLWIVEDDTKTFLAADETEDAFNPKVNTGQDTISVLRRNASAAFIHGCGICWMDLWGNGWLNSPEIWAEIADLRSQAVITRRLRVGQTQVPEVAVLVDEASYSYVAGDPSGVTLQAGLISKSRELIARSGASVGYYLQSDVGLLPDGIKLYLFLNPLRVTTQERQSIRERLQKPGKTLAWIYAPGLFDERGDSPTEVSEIVGMPLKPQPWNSHIGTIFTEERHPVTERLHGGKRLGSDDILNPSYCVADPAAIILGEYAQSGAPSIASKINEGGWKSVFVGEPHLTGELLRGLYRFSGIHVYDIQDDIVQASPSGVLLIHSPYTGQRTIHLYKPSAVYSVYERRIVTQGASTFRAFMRGRATNCFLVGDLDRIASSLGTTADELKAQHTAWKAERDNSQQRNPRGQQNRENSESDADFEGEYGSGEDHDGQGGQAEQQEVIHDGSNESALQPSVAVLVESGLIAGDIDLVDVEFDGEVDEELAPANDVAPLRNEPMSPSRRRRWNRKRNIQAAKTAASPAISMEDLLSDLPPRKPNSLKPDEQ
jgi:hypothetical protein